MATPVNPGHRRNPGSESTAPSDVSQGISVHIVLRGTAANLTADFATLAGTNFASPSAVITWDRA